MRVLVGDIALDLCLPIGVHQSSGRSKSCDSSIILISGEFRRAPGEGRTSNGAGGVPVAL
eukprot:scaffold233665_cov23-Tisochrysis_lutea.AAC.6